MLLQSFKDRFHGRFIWIVFGVIILSFGIAGIGSLRQCSNSKPAATIDGSKISWQEVVNLYHNYSKVNPEVIKLTNKELLLLNMRSYLVRERSLDMQLNKLNFRITDSNVEAHLHKDPNFQETGKFSAKQYALRLEQAGTTPAVYEHSLRNQLLREKLKNAIIQSSFILPQEKDSYKNLWFQERNISYVIIEPSLFSSRVVVSPSEIADYYHANAHQFISKKKVKVAYIPINLDSISKNIQITTANALEYYKQHQDDFIQSERVKVRHILISVNDANAETSLAKINNIYAQLKAGKNFSELAKNNSDDTASAVNGGDLGWIDRGMTVREFENSAFSLQQKDELSEVIKTDFGYHIIQLQERENQKTREFNLVKDDIIQILQNKQAQEEFIALRQKILDLQEKSSNIEAVATAISAKILISDPIEQNSPNTPLALRNQQVSNVLFQQEPGNNNHLIDLDDSSCVLLHVIDKEDVRPLTLAESSLSINNALVTTKAANEVDRFISIINKKLNNQESIDSLLADYKLAFKKEKVNYFTNNKLDPEILTIAFNIHRSNKKFNFKHVKLANGNSVLVLLNNITRITQSDDMVKQVFTLPAKRELSVMEYLLINNSKVVVYDLPKELK